jgi:hypothetical protein
MSEFIKIIALAYIWFYLIRIAKIHFYKIKCGCPYHKIRNILSAHREKFLKSKEGKNEKCVADLEKSVEEFHLGKKN